MELKHAKLILNEETNRDVKTAEINLFDNIGSGSNTGQVIAEEVAYLVDVVEVDSILVKINSGGGSMIEGFGIFSALQSAKKKGVAVNVSIEGLAASMAGIIAMAGDSISMVDYGLLMMHNPHTGGGAVDQKTQEILDKFKQSAVKIITNRTGKSAEEISDLMTEETWLTAEQALEAGFIDVIEVTETESKREEMQNKIYDIAMSLTPKKANKKTNNMKNIISHFGLEESATEQEILDKVAELESAKNEATEKVAEIENKMSEIENKNSDLSARVIEANKELVNVLIDNAIESGKIKKDAKASLVEKAGENVELVKTVIDSVETPKIKLSGLVENKTEETLDSYRELEKNNPAKLEKIKNENFDLFKKMYFNEYKVEYKG